jgi:hypothetical protein
MLASDVQDGGRNSKKRNSLQKTEGKNIRKFQSYASLNFDHHLEHQTPP